MLKIIKEKRKIRFIIAVAKLITAIETMVFIAGGLYLYFDTPAPGMADWGKAIFLIVLVLALSYIALSINVYFANIKIAEIQTKIDSMLKFRDMSRQIDSYLEFARWQSYAK